ncbi:MAG: alpha/beta hydrolase [Ruminococcaceae bacterium]|nr:alpha/beta hydrolase [Oscillospiraceae bacterium]
MNYELKKITFASADGKSTIKARIYVPTEKKIIGVVQLSHGMMDHVGRYEGLAEYLTGEGYVFAGNDHIGHGESAASDDDFGFFANKNGVGKILCDLHSMNEYLRKEFPAFKPILMGHSMGSFLSRLYVRKYPDTVSGHIIHGTGGPMGIILPFGKALVNTLMLFRGKKHRSKFVAKMSFMGYNSKFPEEEGENAWLTRELSLVNGEDRNKYTTFTFTLSAYRDLFRMVGWSNSKKWFKEYPKDIPTLVMSGDMDPVGSYGKGPTYVYGQLNKRGVTDVKLKLYEGARHELFNETCRKEVFDDMKAWLSGVGK